MTMSACVMWGEMQSNLRRFYDPNQSVASRNFNLQPNPNGKRDSDQHDNDP